MKKVAILQSNYIPWKGYFDIISAVDVFVFHDDLQYTKGDWRNRNIIKTPGGGEWLTVPCGTREDRLICEVTLDDHKWQVQHWNKIKNFYSKAPYFNKYKDFFESIYLDVKWLNLSDMNQFVIKKISNELLGIKTIFDDSRKYNLEKTKGDRVIELLHKIGATDYISGPSAKNYISDSDFLRHNIGVSWMNYDFYPEYPQLWGGFMHGVTILDLLFNCGENSKNYMLYLNNDNI